MRLAIVGSGIAGLACAHILSCDHEVVLYEAADRLGGHSNTVIVPEGNKHHAIDTGFIVHNDRNYPNLVRLFDELGVRVQDTEMSFAVTDRVSGFTYRATNLNTIFADRKNIASPTMWRMLVDIVRFYRHANRYLADPSKPEISMADFCRQHRYSDAFMNLHLIPMGAAVWSSSPETFTDFPARSLLRFLSNHGLLGVADRPQWKTINGGSRSYVNALAERFTGEIRTGTPVTGIERTDGFVEVTAGGQRQQFDQIIVACHSDQALKLLTDPSEDEKKVLGAIRYQPNIATLHTDTSLLSPNSTAWAAWNYERLSNRDAVAPITYDLTNLQHLDTETRYLVSLNGQDRVDPERVIATFNYSHPVFDEPALAAQERWSEISGVKRTHYCGAYWKFGFHEDGFSSGLRVCRSLGSTWGQEP